MLRHFSSHLKIQSVREHASIAGSSVRGARSDIRINRLFANDIHILWRESYYCQTHNESGAKEQKGVGDL